jgi:hypothetical protein
MSRTIVKISHPPVFQTRQDQLLVFQPHSIERIDFISAYRAEANFMLFRVHYYNLLSLSETGPQLKPSTKQLRALARTTFYDPQRIVADSSMTPIARDDAFCG